MEHWLNKLEKEMRTTIHALLLQTNYGLREKGMKKDRWVKEWPGQLLITASQMGWTTDCEKALEEVEAGSKQAMRTCRKAQAKGLAKFADMLRKPINKLTRRKLMALITIEVHSRDVIERMMKTQCTSTTDFGWLQQLRAYWVSDLPCNIRREGGQSLVIGGSSLVILEGKACNPL